MVRFNKLEKQLLNIKIMKIYIYLLLGLISCSITQAQVGIGTITPNENAILEVSSTSQGVGFPRMTTAERDAIQDPVEALIIYNTTADCLQVNTSSDIANPIWVCLGIPTLAPLPTNIQLGQRSDFFVASVLDNDYLPYDQDDQPATAETGTFNADNNTATPPNEPPLDIQGSIPPEATPAVIRIPYTVTGPGSINLPLFSQTVTVPGEFTESGTASDITFRIPAQTNLTQGANKFINAQLFAVGVTALDIKKLDLNVGLGQDNLGILLGSFTYVTNATADTESFNVRAVPGIPDRAFGNGDNDLLYLPVASTTGAVWLNNNLGADYANINKAAFNINQQATSRTDANAYGSLYQWGRLTDGHELINRTSGAAVNGTTTTQSIGDQPVDNSFIRGSSDWRSPQNDNLWQGVNGINNPCPSGYRIPTQAEWQAEYNAFSPNNAAGAFASPLKLPLAGYRKFSNGSVRNVGSIGDYWSSTVSGTNVRLLNFSSSNARMFAYDRAYGFSVRCLKD
jgi:uncharacterized protein (TIGR02145 family)